MKKRESDKKRGKGEVPPRGHLSNAVGFSCLLRSTLYQAFASCNGLILNSKNLRDGMEDKLKEQKGKEKKELRPPWYRRQAMEVYDWLVAERRVTEEVRETQDGGIISSFLHPLLYIRACVKYQLTSYFSLIIPPRGFLPSLFWVSFPPSRDLWRRRHEAAANTLISKTYKYVPLSTAIWEIDFARNMPEKL